MVPVGFPARIPPFHLFVSVSLLLNGADGRTVGPRVLSRTRWEQVLISLFRVVYETL